MRYLQIPVGTRFGFGVITDPDAGRDHTNKRLIQLLCHPHEGGCGTIYVTRLQTLRSGQSISCGCAHLDATSKHGLYRHPLYSIWQNMISRCENPAASGYRHYGGRTPPVTVWGPWHDPALFIADVERECGPRPEGRTAGGLAAWTLNRKDNTRGYEPGNVEWADWFTQARNHQGAERGAIHRRQVAELRAAGLSTTQIATSLAMSRRNVRYLEGTYGS